MRAIFLDRDGVINRYPGDRAYVTSYKHFRFLPNAKKAIARLTRKHFKIFVVSNQAGVGKGVYPQEALDEITRRMLQEVEAAGGKITAVYYCIHRPEDNCPCRKPRAGLISLACKNYPLNLKKSFFIGDTIRDVNTARAAGCQSILVFSGKEKLRNRKTWEAQPDFTFSSLSAAADFILKNPKL